jgi:hypothetical protein
MTAAISIPPFLSQFPDDIIHLILETCLDVYSDADAYNYYHHSASNMRLRHHAMHPRRTIPLVCKLWRDISRPYLWRTLHLRYSRLVEYASFLAKHPAIAAYVRHLMIGMTSNPDIAIAGMSIIRSCHNIKVLNLIIYSGAILQKILDPISNLLELRRLVLRLPFSPSRAFLRQFVSIANDCELQSLHLGLTIFTEDYLHEVLAPFFEELAVPEVRITSTNYAAGQPGWLESDIQALAELCEENENIGRLELCGIPLESDFLYALRVYAAPPTSRDQKRRILDVLYISDRESEEALLRRLYQSPQLPGYKYRWSKELELKFSYEWMQVEA